MARTNEFENKIPAFYRKRTIDLLLFAHVTAMHERCDMSLDAAIKDFLCMYGISEDEYPASSALRIYHRVRNNFIWSNIKKNL